MMEQATEQWWQKFQLPRGQIVPTSSTIMFYKKIVVIVEKLLIIYQLF